MNHIQLSLLAYRSLGAGAAILLVAAAPRAQSSCLQWADGFGAIGVAKTVNDQTILDQVVYDDGTGPVLVACGYFESAGSVAAELAQWDGQRWSEFGGAGASTYSGQMHDLAVYDAGGGPELYVGGVLFTIGGVSVENIAKWNGTTWQPVGSGLAHPINDMLVFDDGGGPQLYVAGYSGSGSGGYSAALARWNGSTWSMVGGVDPLPNPISLAVHDDGSGPALYVGGQITQVGALGVHNLVRWDGTTWSEVGGGINGGVYRMVDHDDGSGAALYVGGEFSKAGGVTGFRRLACWKNGAWSPLGSGALVPPEALGSFDDGNGAKLYVGLALATIGGVTVNGVGVWDGTNWSGLGSPIGFEQSTLFNGVVARSFCVHDDGSGAGSSLFVGGRFGFAGGVRADQIARWNANGWSAVGRGNGLDYTATAFGTFHSGAGNELYVAGDFRCAGSASITSLAKWNGSSWSPATSTPFYGDILAFQEFDDGTGAQLYVGGIFYSIDGVATLGIARWNGAQWSDVGGGGVNGTNVTALATWNDGTGSALWVGGNFTSISGTAARCLARWDGSAWSSPAPALNAGVTALQVYDAGSGPELYVAGDFTSAGTLPVQGIARWNGSSWSSVGSGFNAHGAKALAVFDDGSGSKLYVSSPSSAEKIKRWDGANWTSVGQSLNTNASDLEVFDDGWGSALYACGTFTQSGSTLLPHIARWNGVAWSAPSAGGVNGPAYALKSFDDGSGGGPSLFVGGSFVTAGASGSSYIAALERRCPCPPRVYCTAGTSSNGCVPTIAGVGAPSASAATSFVITAQNVEGQKFGLLFYGLSGALAAPWGTTSSYLCVKPPQQRTNQANSGGTSGACDGALSLDWNAYLASHPNVLGQPFQPGALVRMQGWYRDPPSSKTTSLTDGLEFLICP